MDDILQKLEKVLTLVRISVVSIILLAAGLVTHIYLTRNYIFQTIHTNAVHVDATHAEINAARSEAIVSDQKLKKQIDKLSVKIDALTKQLDESRNR